MAYRTRKASKNEKIPKLDRGGTILEFLISGESPEGSPGQELAVSEFFDDSQHLIEETRAFYKDEIAAEMKRREPKQADRESGEPLRE